MGTLREHRAKWSHNRSFLGTIDDEYADWMVVVMFYTALHAVEALFVHDNTKKHTSHTERNRTLKTTNRYRQIWQCYRELHDAARTMRYDPAEESWIPITEVKGTLIGCFYRLEKSVLKLLESKEDLGPVWPD